MYTVKHYPVDKGKSMKVSREQAAQNRERIIDTAARLFRERGFDGIGVADLMQNAGLTHGGFYGQFASKEDLAALACERALGQSATRIDRVIAEHPENTLQAVAASYLSKRHRDNPGDGCAFVALGAEAPRHEAGVRKVFAQALLVRMEKLMRLIPGTPAARRRKALSTMASMVGAQVLARAVDDATLSTEILEAVKASI
ncbi:MAG: Transcriptional regulator, TetR family [Betaproteobacteria bacterium]|nr:Transcriptional regulator, TetR family [Betaproteobacteria bacterium]